MKHEICVENFIIIN